MTKCVTQLTQKYLKSILHYDPLSGDFTWLISPRYRICIGDLAGFIGDKKYRLVRIKGKDYPAHRLVFLWVKGRLPLSDVDHINHVRNDNRWDNLRECTRCQNMGNQRIGKNNKSGYKGVHFHKQRNKWQSSIGINGKTKYLGLFDCKYEAAKTYNLAAINHFGKFALLNEGIVKLQRL